MATGPEKVPGNFHALYDQGTRAARGVSVASGRAERPEIARMVAEMPDAAVYLDEATQNPVQITAGRRPGRLSMRAASSPESAAREFVRDRADLWQLSDQDLGTVDVVSVSTRGLPTVRMVQKVGGVEVFQSDMTAALGADNSVVSATGQLFHGAATAPERGARRTAAASGAGAVSLQEQDAIAKAAFDLTGYPYKPQDFKAARAAARKDAGPYRSYDSKWKAGTATKPAADKQKEGNAGRAKKAEAPRFERPVRVKDVLFPLGEGEFVPG
jgi:extracellular elastinolytic metalloproteinase